MNSPHPRWLLCLSLAALLAPAALAQTTWHVDVNAPPPGNGTAANPFPSIQQALFHPPLSHADLILVAPGIYEERVVFTKGVTVRSALGPLVTRIEPRSLGPYNSVVDLGGTLEGFTVSGAALQHSIGVAGVGTLRRCIVTAHRDDAGGGNFFNGTGVLSDFDLWAENCSVSGNDYGVSFVYVSAVYLRNCVVQGNKFWDLDPVLFATISTFDYTLVGSGAPPGTGNLGGDPRFWNAPQGDYHLGPLSPCIDAGDPAFPPDPNGSVVDLGALTYDPDWLPPISSYCTGKLNSQGCVPSIHVSGGPAASVSSATPFVVGASGVVENTVGILFYGFARDIKPFHGAFHCVKAPTPRTPGQLSGSSGAPCSGAFALDFNAWIQSGLALPVPPGSIIAAQHWYRDVSDPAGFGTGLSGAIEFPVGL